MLESLVLAGIYRIIYYYYVSIHSTRKHLAGNRRAMELLVTRRGLLGVIPISITLGGIITERS